MTYKSSSNGGKIDMNTYLLGVLMWAREGFTQRARDMLYDFQPRSAEEDHAVDYCWKRIREWEEKAA